MPVVDFVPCPMGHIPKPVIKEFRVIFEDLQAEPRGYLLGTGRLHEAEPCFFPAVSPSLFSSSCLLRIVRRCRC